MADDGLKFRMLNVIDEFTRECLAIRGGRRPRSTDVIDVLSDLFILRGVQGHVRSDNGPQFIARAVQNWNAPVGVRTTHIAPGSPWENGYCESFNAKLRDELLGGEIFYSLGEVRLVIDGARRHCTTPYAHTPRTGTDCRRPRPSCHARARLRNPGQLRRARSPWKLGRP